MNIFLMGFMGCGKSTIGKKIAKLIDYQFIDFDELIVNQEQLSISELFNTYGETYFRALETNILKKETFNNSVIALGGGTPCFNQNLAEIATKGLTIYLKLPPTTLAHRLINAKEKRPLIEANRHDYDELLNQIENLLDERESYYNQADIIFNAENMNPDKYIDLLNKIENYFLNIL
jgi:shikimate kinase